MKNMTELEQHIYDSIKDTLEEKLEIVRKFGNLESKFIEVPFVCGGCIDRLVYDVELGRFTKIRYSKGVKNGTSIGGLMGNHEAYFNQEDIQHFEFDI